MAERRLERAVALVLALVAVAFAISLSRAVEPPATTGGEPASAITAPPLGIEAGMLGAKLDRTGEQVARLRPDKAHSPGLLLAVLVAAGGVATLWRRQGRPLAVPLVVAHPLSGIGRRAPPFLQRTVR
jgi:hypothetical protein